MIRNIGIWLVKLVGWSIGNNNGRMTLLWVITVVLLIKAICSGLGEPILANFAERVGADASAVSAQVDMVYKIHQNLPLDQPLPMSTPKPSLWWSWCWWLATLCLFIISAIYTPVALREEIADIGQKAWARLREREETDARATATPPPTDTGTPQTPPRSTRVRDSFSRLFSIDLLAEFVWGIIQRLPARFLARRP